MIEDFLHGIHITETDRGQGGPVPPPPALAPLALSLAIFTAGLPAAALIMGRQAGSTLDIIAGALPAGMALNSGPGTITGTPAAAGSASFTLRETLAGADNSPRDTLLTIAVMEDVENPPPVFTAPYHIAANPTPIVTDLVSAAGGVVVGTGPVTLAWQWLRDGADIAGATADSYRLAEADRNARIGLRVTATDVNGSSVSLAEEIGPVLLPAYLARTVQPPAPSVGGYMLRIDGAWTPPPDRTLLNGPYGDPTHGHTDYALMPTTAPKATVTVTGPGHTVVAGAPAFSAATQRTLVLTTPNRRGFQPDLAADPTGQTALPEFDHPTANGPFYVKDEPSGIGGWRFVELALSGPIYSGETATLHLLDNWRREGIAADLIIDNSENTLANPIGVFRYAQSLCQTVRGESSITLWVAGATLMPGPGNEPLAAMRLSITDGVNIVNILATQQQWHPDGWPGWRFDCDLSPLNPGPLTVHRSEYPWWGHVRHSSGEIDPGVTPVQAGSMIAAYAIAPTAPTIIAYDPAGTRYPARFVQINPASTTPSGTAAAVTTNEAAALAADANAKPATLSAAIQLLALQSYSYPAANGWAASGTRALDACTILTPDDGVFTKGATAINSGAGCLESHVIVRPPATAITPRDTVILRTNGEAALNPRIQLMRFTGFRAETGHGPLFTNVMRNLRIEDMTVRAKAGYETSTNSWISAGAPAGECNADIIGCDWRVCGNTLAQNFPSPRLVRNIIHDNRIRAASIIGNEFIRPTHGFFTPTATVALYAGRADTNGQIAMACKALRADGFLYDFDSDQTVMVSGSAVKMIDAVVENMLFERFDAKAGGGTKLLRLGENTLEASRCLIVQGNTMVGQRISFHNDAIPYQVDLPFHPWAFRWNLSDRFTSKSADTFNFMPGHIGHLPNQFQCLWGANVNAERSTLGLQFPYLYDLLEIRDNPLGGGPGAKPLYFGFVSDLSAWTQASQVAAGGGDYRISNPATSVARMSGAMAAVPGPRYHRSGQLRSTHSLAGSDGWAT